MTPDFACLLNQSENEDLRRELLALLRMQAAAYTQGDSASLPAETLMELLASLLYTLSIDLAHPPTFAPLAVKDLRPLYEAGYQSLLDKTAQAKALIQTLCREAPPLGCLSLSSTVCSIAAALDHYDARFFAHRIPGEIDYQLANPIPEHVQGIDYIQLYLMRLRAELRFIARFPAHRVLALLDGACPGWQEQIGSLCAPVAANALGLALLHENPCRLHIRTLERQKLLDLLALLHPLDIENRLTHQSAGLLHLLDLNEPQDAALLHALCRDLAPRVSAASKAGDLSHVFAAFSVPVNKAARPAHRF